MQVLRLEKGTGPAHVRPLSPHRHDDRDPILESVDHGPEGVSRARHRMEIHDRGRARRAGVAVGHGHDRPLVESLNVLQANAVDERVEKRDLLRAAETEDVRDLPFEEKLRHHLAAGEVVDRTPRSIVRGLRRDRGEGERTGELRRRSSRDSEPGEAGEELPSSDASVQQEPCRFPHHRSPPTKWMHDTTGALGSDPDSVLRWMGRDSILLQKIAGPVQARDAQLDHGDAGNRGENRFLEALTDLVGSRDRHFALVENEAKTAFVRLAQGELSEPVGGSLGLVGAKGDSLERPDSVGMIEKALLPEDVGRRVLDEEDLGLGKDLGLDVHDAKQTRLRPFAVGHVPPDLDRLLQPLHPVLARLVEIGRPFAAEGDDLDAVELLRQRAEMLERPAGIGDPQDLEIALTEHGAAVARAPELDRPVGGELPLVRALLGEPKPQGFVVFFRGAQVGRHQRDVIESERAVSAHEFLPRFAIFGPNFS